MPKIRNLPPDVVGRIAAGEVVERPASVLKELLENSLDAGASHIRIETEGAGARLLRVVDDGEGMDPQDCRAAFERHATSKLAAIDDLERLATFGFRGEALYSIGAVSKAVLSSCPRGTDKGWSVEVSGGKVVAGHEAPPIPGTSVEIRDLFHNTPARSKFLKSDAVERSHLARVIEEAALAHPGVSLAWKSEGRASLRFDAVPGDPGSPASRLERVREVLGEEAGSRLLAASESGAGLGVTAFLSPPDALVPTRSLQFFFVNGRPVSSRLLQQALYRAYEPLRREGRHPAAVVHLDIPPDQFDVNVHPAKREVRFRRERPLFEALAGACSAVLLRSRGLPAVDRPAAARAGGVPAAGTVPPSQGTLLLDRRATGYAAEAPEAPTPSARWYTPPFVFLGQIEKTYLVFDAAGGLLVVDQHAAQERVFFERYEADLERGDAPSQPLMVPVSLELPASQIQSLLARAGKLKRTGLEIEPFGKTSLHVTAAPAAFQRSGDLKEMVQRLLESVLSETSAALDARRHAVATIACKAAVKAHDRLGAAEALKLLDDLKDCRDGTCCPHGRPAMISLSRDELARRFRRPGAPPL